MRFNFCKRLSISFRLIITRIYLMPIISITNYTDFFLVCEKWSPCLMEPLLNDEFIFIHFILVVPWFFFPGFIATVFLDVYGFVTVVIFCYVCTFHMPKVLWIVPLFPISCAGTLVLRFYGMGFFIFSWHFWSWLFVHLVIFHQKLVTNILDS